MRVIAGTAKGRRLESVPGDGTRPITDRAKEALFSILQSEIAGARVLDLFAGTGSVGIEALSRGAAYCRFVEREWPALETIRGNLARTGLAPGAELSQADVFTFLARPPVEPFDLIFVAPPQYLGLWAQSLLALDATPGWLAPDGVAVVQIHPRELEELELSSLVEEDRRRYGSVMFLFFGRRHVVTSTRTGQ